MMTNIFLSFFRISVSTGLIVALLILLAPFLNKRYASKWKYWVWILLALRLVIPLGGTDGKSVVDAVFQIKAQTALKSEENEIDNLPGQAEPVGRINVELPAQVTTPISMQFTEGNVSITLLDVAAFVWMLGSVVFISVHLISYLHYNRQVIKKGTSIKDTCILRQVSELKRELHIKCTVHTVRFPDASSPMIIGFFKPVLILPDEKYTSEELFFILKHELVHCKRRDLYIKLLLVAANAIHWFNPFIWIMQKEAAIDMELSCDERVTQGADYAMRKAYTETLLSTLHKGCVKRTALSTQFYGGKQIMKKRFKNILNNGGKKNGAVLLICAAILTATLGTMIGCSVTSEKEEDIHADVQGEAADNEPENIVLNDSQPVVEIPQNGQIHGYISQFDNGSVTIDRQLWVTTEDEDWKPEYNEAAGFEVVDAQEEDIVYPLYKDCTYSVLENHYDPVVELDEEEFKNYLSEMEYPVLWIIQLEDGQITGIREQYVP